MTEIKKRLRFIDMGRSIAIILMLQGHFISLTLEGYRDKLTTLRTEGTSGSLIFDWWCQLRGFTAPLFFTITGLVFVYLLLGNQDQEYFKQIRVRKGFKRAISIILWGYALQLNFQNINYYLSGNINDRFFAFHVLHCIGFGIILLLIIYGLYRLLHQRIKIYWILLPLGFTIFLVQPLIASLGSQHIPAGAPKIIQNMIHGPHSIFPLTPWVGFVLFGGAIGAIIRDKKEMLGQKWFPIRFMLTGVLVLLIGPGILYIIDTFSLSTITYLPFGYLFHQVMEAVVLIGLLMYLERIIPARNSMFILMGQNTLVIYILHVVLLYGAIIGIGLRTYLQKSLSFGEAILGALLFILFFALLTKTLPYFTSKYNGLKKVIFQRSKPSDLG